MVNQTVNVRCPAPVIELLDTVGDIYGLTRSELLRAGGIMYCQQLMATDSLKTLLTACYAVADKAGKDNLGEEDLKDLDAMEKILNDLQGQLGVK